MKHLLILLLLFGLTQSQMSFIQKHWINPQTRTVTILIDESLANGSDAACETASKIFHAITTQGYRLFVISPNGFVPSAVNPMDASWTTQLELGH